MTPARIAELRALVEAGTKGPWSHYDEVFRASFSQRRVTEIQRARDGLTLINWTGFDGLQPAARRAKNRNAALIVAAVNELGPLLDEVERLRGAFKTAIDELEDDGQAIAADIVRQALEGGQ